MGVAVKAEVFVADELQVVREDVLISRGTAGIGEDVRTPDPERMTSRLQR